ncbi:efflux RND transporter periplasmic adaptor subunit [Planctomycetes bacterium K23_9]|uniref:Multidrug resistance protein MdtA n=1 Tax=Stieleria marina TaxID=1930275 RepID=A0A517NXF2_9BACT|nr:Multidrug resistance protein MdtA precursor [Planctomycetes bacterium K23_9]
MSEVAPRTERWWIRFLTSAVVCLAILGGAVAAIVVINRTEPTAKQINATRKSAALVQTQTAKRGTFSPRLVVLGSIEPAREIVLGPRVRGQVIDLSPSFSPGGMVRQGDLLLRIDPADFQNALSITKSELEQAEAKLAIEEGRQSLAKKELELLQGTIEGTNRALVLREPQIASIRAEVNAAKAAVERAALDLDRANIYAPFNAQVLSRSVNVGSQVTTGDELARLAGVNEYWVFAAVPVRSLRWVNFPTGDQPGSLVTLRNPDAWAPGVERHARVSRMIGSVDQQTRLARVLITVSDPLGQTSNAPPLILDSLIETEIEGRPIENVVRLEREFVRDRDTVWVMLDDKLQIRDTTVVFRDAAYAYISEGLNDGDQIVVSTLATVAEGVGLRKIDDVGEAAADFSEATQ